MKINSEIHFAEHVSLQSYFCLGNTDARAATVWSHSEDTASTKVVLGTNRKCNGDPWSDWSTSQWYLEK